MSQIKVRAGQVYASKTGTEVKVESVNQSSGTIFYIHPHFGYALAANVGNFLISYKFVPQNDFETLAVKLDKWYCAAAWIKIKQGVPFICEEFEEGAINRYQWQLTRYYLGLDKKPHYERVDGEWVKK